jgi:hypothetical protein
MCHTFIFIQKYYKILVFLFLFKILQKFEKYVFGTISDSIYSIVSKIAYFRLRFMCGKRRLEIFKAFARKDGFN